MEARMMLDRRDFLGVAGGTAAAVFGGMPGGNRAQARVSIARAQVPGFYRFSLGQFQITVVSDGTISFPCEELWPEAAKEDRDAVLAGDFQPTDNATLQVNVLAVNTGDRLVLIDAGSRGKFQPTASRLLENLAAAEIKPEQVDTILITHFHPDHLWGVSDDNDAERTFPNAEYVIGEAEWNFWMQPQHPLANDAFWEQVYSQNMKTVATIKDRVRTVKPNGEVVTGITTIATPGHTPGHTSVHIASGSDDLLCTADVVGNRAVGFQRPDWRGGFDLDLEQGAKTRRAFLERCESEKAFVSSYHLPFPGLGHIARAGTAFHWVPSDWRWEGVSPT
jgi:glyoxylase-like metal-dependent hydrolase (beta-lactamase superfamily II)